MGLMAAKEWDQPSEQVTSLGDQNLQGWAELGMGPLSMDMVADAVQATADSRMALAAAAVVAGNHPEREQETRVDLR